MKEVSFRQALEKTAKVSFLGGHSIQILKDGGPAFDEAFYVIDQAVKMICLEFYIIRDDETGWDLAERLARKCREGVEVYLIYDHYGCLTTSRGYWDFLRQSGVRLRPFHPWRWSKLRAYLHRNHRKVAVVDGRAAFTGGLNVGDEYHGYMRRKLTGWRDTGVMVKGPVAGLLSKAFWETWRECGGVKSRAARELPPGSSASEEGVEVMPLLSSSRKSQRALRRLLQLSVRSARRSIHLTMAYFIPTGRFLRALIRAARRGVDVRIILPGQCDLRIVSYVSRTFFKILLREGVKLYLYQPRVLHAKTMVVDREWTIVGSANLDPRSLNYNYEAGIGILDPVVGEEMEMIFQADLLESQPVREEDLSRWPFHERLLGSFFAWFRSYL